MTLGCCAGLLGASLFCSGVVGQGKGWGSSPSCPYELKVKLFPASGPVSSSLK